MKDRIDTFLTKASLKGLRTLLMGVKIIEENELREFQMKVAEAEKDILGREKKLEQIFEDFEQGFCILGATAVEDRLRDNVPETINDL